MLAFLIAMFAVSIVAYQMLKWLGDESAGVSYWKWLGDRFRQVHLWQVGLAIAIFAGAMALARLPEGIMTVLLFGLALALWRSWRREFVFLMSLDDSSFPGRFDKIIWVIFFALLPPVGTFAFRSYRLHHWPESERSDARGTTEQANHAKPKAAGDYF